MWPVYGEGQPDAAATAPTSRRGFLEDSVRGLLGGFAASEFVATGVLGGRSARAETLKDSPATMTLGMGNYGLQSLPVGEAIDLIDRLGFDALELSLMPDWPSAPGKLGADTRAVLRSRLASSGLKLRALMEDLPPAADDETHRQQLERLRRAADLGRQLSPDSPPLLQTVLGGGAWEEQRPLFARRLAEWRDLAEREQFRIAIKPHRAGAMSTPAQGLSLLRELGDSPWLGLVFDYSHYAFRDLPLQETLAEALPRVWHVAVKDVRRRDAGFEFDLPGVTGTIDHAAMLVQLREGGYRGDVCCEISSQVFKRAGYDPVAAATTCARTMTEAFRAAGIPRPERRK